MVVAFRLCRPNGTMKQLLALADAVVSVRLKGLLIKHEGCLLRGFPATDDEHQREQQ